MFGLGWGMDPREVDARAENGPAFLAGFTPPRPVDVVHVLVVGASGTVGRVLVPHLLAGGHRVTVTSRDPARHAWPHGVRGVAWDPIQPLDLPAGAGEPPIAGVVNLAGAGVMDRRWSERRREELVTSRLTTTRRLAEWIAAQRDPPVLVSASAAGYYGSRPPGPCTEATRSGLDFLAGLCIQWEAAAAQSTGRVVVLRLGHVLAREGGYLGALRGAARFGVARMGNGRQPMPWVHAGDVARAIAWALEGPASGTYNVAAPGGVAQRTFARLAVDRIAGPRWPLIGVPALALRIRFGEAADAILGGQALVPARLQQEGFAFAWPGLAEALDDLLGRARLRE